MGIKVVHTFHGIHQDDSLLGKLKLMMDYALRNLIDYYICVSKSERNVALKKRLCQEDNSSVVFNGINYESLRQKTQLLQRENSLSQWKLPKNKKVIGVLARNDFAKGIEILLENLAYFKKKFPEMMPCCVIAGGGYFSNKNAKYLNRLNLAGDVLFLGEVSEPASVFIMLDVYVSNSRWEGLPLSVMEAMSLGIPCLLSNVAGHQDLIEDGVTGHLFPLRNPEKFTQYLKEFLTEDSGQYVDAAKKKIERDFSLSSMVKGILKIYEKVYKGTT
jgi:glycosyltransferase involved in cell wall biosynthesis